MDDSNQNQPQDPGVQPAQDPNVGGVSADPGFGAAANDTPPAPEGPGVPGNPLGGGPAPGSEVPPAPAPGPAPDTNPAEPPAAPGPDESSDPTAPASGAL